MSSPDRLAHTFIVRIWIEPREIAGAPPEWRGEVKHVPSGQTRYFRNLASVSGTLEQLIREEERERG